MEDRFSPSRSSSLRMDGYFGTGVPLVWVINPYRRTVQICSPNAAPILVNDTQELTAEPHLPGFRVPAAHLFPN
jgi:Uma2 family endonuclease